MICRAIPYEGKEPYLFLSYCHQDRDALYPLFAQLASEGCRLWYDDGNHPGEDWVENIEDHLEQSNACLAFISAGSSMSHNCKREIIYALKCRKKVIPVLIEDVELPKGLRMQLVDMHYLKRWDFPSDGELLKKLYKLPEIKACKADSSAGLLRSDAEPEPPVKREQLSEKSVGGILSRLFSGSLKPKNPDMKPEEPEPLQASAPSEKEHPQEAGTPKAGAPQRVRVKGVVSSKRVKNEPVLPPEIPSVPKADPGPSMEAASHEEPEQNPEEGTVLQRMSCLPDDEGTVLDPDFDDDKTVAVPRSSPALLLCPGKNRVFILSKPRIAMGRSAIKCDVLIEGNGSISKHHADIIMLNGKYYLSDAGSTNGTFLNGAQLEPDKQVQLENPAVFKLYDELMIFFSGPAVNRLIHRDNICLLINEAETAVRIIDEAVVPLNRIHRWPDGTLGDLEIHRNAHAAVCLGEEGCRLKDEDSRNGTYLNDVRLNQGASSVLSSGDRIRLGKTTLRFYSISMKGDTQ